MDPMPNQVVTIRINTALFVLIFALILMAASMYNCPLRYAPNALVTLSTSIDVNITHINVESNHSLDLIPVSVEPPCTPPVIASVLHAPIPKPFCLVGSLYGQVNNQILAISWAWMLARKLNLSLLLTFTDGSDYLCRNWASTFGNMLGISWGSNNETEECDRSMSWHDAFQEMLAQRASVPDDNWPLVTPILSVRTQARLLWGERVLAHGSYMTVHGRSFENTMGQCLSSEHSGYACVGEHLCDYRLHVVLNTFGAFLNTTVDPNHIVLFTDGQNQEYAREYPVIEHEGNFFVHMWMMVLSRIHIAHPGSTVDYVIWRWRQSLHDEWNEDGQRRFMLPWKCYNNHSFQDEYI
jgi:hypothetical protein